MKLHMRDRFAAMLGVGLLSFLVAVSYYYAIKGDFSGLRTKANADSPDFIAQKIILTEFEPDGTAKQRFFADQAEHYADGRMTATNPRIVSLDANTPQTRASASMGTSIDNGKSFVFSGNVRIHKAGDLTRPPMSFTSSTVTVFPDTSRFHTSAPVVLENGADITTGVGLDFDNVDHTLVIRSAVRTSIVPRNQDSVPAAKRKQL